MVNYSEIIVDYIFGGCSDPHKTTRFEIKRFNEFYKNTLQYAEFGVWDCESKCWIVYKENFIVENKLITTPFFVKYHYNMLFRDCIITKEVEVTIPYLFNRYYGHEENKIPTLNMSLVNCKII